MDDRMEPVWMALKVRVGSLDGWLYMGDGPKGHCFRLRDDSGAGRPHRYEYIMSHPLAGHHD